MECFFFPFEFGSMYCYRVYWEQSPPTCQCDLSTNYSDHIHSSLPLDYKWMMIPLIMNAFGQFLLMISAFEFLCAQSPYSMKGLLFGFSYGCVGFLAIIGYSLLILVKLIVKKWLSNSHYGCLSWYILIDLVLLLTLFIMFYISLKCYKTRLRDNSEGTFVVHM